MLETPSGADERPVMLARVAYSRECAIKATVGRAGRGPQPIVTPETTGISWGNRTRRHPLVTDFDTEAPARRLQRGARRAMKGVHGIVVAHDPDSHLLHRAP